MLKMDLDEYYAAERFYETFEDDSAWVALCYAMILNGDTRKEDSDNKFFLFFSKVIDELMSPQ